MNRKGLPLIIITGQMLSTMAAVTLINSDSDIKAKLIFAGFFFYITGLAAINFFPDNNESLSFLKIFRLLRHDFQNHLQILYSMIQLKKYEDALKYIDDVKNNEKTINYICNNLTDITMIFFLIEMLYQLRKKGISMTVEVTDESLNLPQLSYLKKEIEHFILRIDKIQGNKDVKIVLRNSKIEMFSEAIGNKVIYDGKHIA